MNDGQNLFLGGVFHVAQQRAVPLKANFREERE
jgi:hypothetical protein